jgi:hypothetical protein
LRDGGSIAVDVHAYRGVERICRESASQHLENPSVSHPKSGKQEQHVTRVVALEFLENSKKRAYRGRTQLNESLYQLIANIVWIPAHQLSKEWQRFRRPQAPEDIY